VLLYFRSYSKEGYLKLKEYFKRKINTVYIVDCLDNDFDVELMLSSDKEFFNLLEQLKEDFHNLIEEIEYWIFFNTIKVNYLPNIK
jgi:hypothetical protein